MSNNKKVIEIVELIQKASIDIDLHRSNPCTITEELDIFPYLIEFTVCIYEERIKVDIKEVCDWHIEKILELTNEEYIVLIDKLVWMIEDRNR